MELTGHSVCLQLGSVLGDGVKGEILTALQKEVFAVRFDPTGQNIASGSFDRSIRNKIFPKSCYVLVQFTDRAVIQWSGKPTATAQTTFSSVATKAPSSIFNGLVTRPSSSLRLLTLCWHHGMWTRARGSEDM